MTRLNFSAHTRVLTVAAVTALLAGCGSFSAAPKPAPISSGKVAYAEQKIAWQRCGKFECATVQAPLDWDNPDAGKSITLNLTRLVSHAAKPLGTIFLNPGGPGASGTEYLQSAAGDLEKLRAQYHVAAWDPRGVNNSTAVDCLTPKEQDADIYGKSDTVPGTVAWLQATYEANRKTAKKCAARSGELIKHVSTGATIADLDLLRQLVGDAKLNYMGFSYGTYIGARYAHTYPQLVGKLVLDGAMDPTTSVSEVVLAQTKGFELALRNYLTACLQRDCWTRAATVEQALQEISQLLAKVDKQPLRAADGRWVTSSVFVTAIIAPLYSEDSWEFLDMLFNEIAAGKTDIALRLADFYYDRNADGTYANNSSQAFHAINCADYVQKKPNLAQMRKETRELVQQAPILGKYQGFSGAGCWGWPVSAKERITVSAAGAAPIVVIGTTGDPATPYEWAKALSSQLASGILVTFEGEGHVAYGSSKCVTTLVADYFVGGKLPAHDTVCSE